MSKIFISYRRHDSRPVATLIYDPLAKHFEANFGAGAVFMDVHGIPLGVNFRAYLNEQVGKAELLLALIANRWLTAVDESGTPELRSFARGLRHDREAVQAGITLCWSNGMTEGFVNKVKTYKRAMYGRAKLDLLRLRVLLAA